MSSSIVCVQCGHGEFERRSGAFFCRRCRLRSEEHGQETDLDAESIGAFSSDIASTLRTKSGQT